MASKVNHTRAETLTHLILSYVLHYLGEWHSAAEHAERSVRLARNLGTPRFEAIALCYLGNARAHLGSRTEGEAEIEQACAISLDKAVSSSGPWVLSVLALNTPNPDRQAWALDKGEQILAQDCISHNYLFFYQNAMEASLERGDWEAVERYAEKLSDYTQDKPLPWSDFFIARGRALASHGQGLDNLETRNDLQQLRDQGDAAGLNIALPALDAVLGAG